MRKILAYVAVSGILLFSIKATFAVGVMVEFSAEAVQIVPMQPPMTVKMFVSKKAVRSESEFNGLQRVEIFYPEEPRRVLLLPSQKRYLEQLGSKQVKKTKSTKEFNPCAELPAAQCQLLGKETINDRKTQKWEITKIVNGQQQRSLHWIDSKRRMAIREFFANGTVSELKFLGDENINNRQTEKWQMQITTPDGRKIQSQQWYDPELKMAIREELAGGYLRELKNIKIGKQDKKLFLIPKDFQKTDMSMMRGQYPNRPYAPGAQ